MPMIEPTILRWARETAGLSLEDAANRVGIGDARGVPGAQRLAAMEDKASDVSRPVLLKMSKVYHRPLIAFYMKEPPARGDRGEDFRTLPDRNTGAEPLVDTLVRDIKARQSAVRAIMVDEEEAESLKFIASMAVADGIDRVLASIRKALNIDVTAFRAKGSSDLAFAYLRDAAEAAGIFVLLIGNLGTYRSAIDVDAFRGFAIADDIAPFVVVNDQDAKTAWSFTLLHEVAHLWIGATGLSGAHAEGPTEQFCNDVASEFLLPATELRLLDVGRNTNLAVASDLITAFANQRHISRSLVAYRLFRAQRISAGTWRELTDRFRREWVADREAQREKNRAQDGGPPYYVVRRHRLGSALLNLVARNMGEGSLTPTRAARILGVKARSVYPLLVGATAVKQGA